MNNKFAGIRLFAIAIISFSALSVLSCDRASHEEHCPDYDYSNVVNGYYTIPVSANELVFERSSSSAFVECLECQYGNSFYGAEVHRVGKFPDVNKEEGGMRIKKYDWITLTYIDKTSGTEKEIRNKLQISVDENTSGEQREMDVIMYNVV